MLAVFTAALAMMTAGAVSREVILRHQMSRAGALGLGVILGAVCWVFYATLFAYTLPAWAL